MKDLFEEAIWAAPDDDLPRLVYADWLDENGDPELAAWLRGPQAAQIVGYWVDADGRFTFRETFELAADLPTQEPPERRRKRK